MDFRDIGFKRFLKHYGEQHLFEEALKNAYSCGYEDGWRDKQAKEVKESAKSVLFVFDQSEKCYEILKESLLDHILHTDSNSLNLDDGSVFHIYSPIQIKHGALRDSRFNIAYIDGEHDNKRNIEKDLLTHLEPMNSKTLFVTFDEFKEMNFEEVWNGNGM